MDGHSSGAGARGWIALLILAIATQPFANGRWSIAIVAWLAPMLLLRVIRSQPLWRGVAIGWLVFVGGWVVQWWQIINLPRAWFALIALAAGTTGFLPFVADRVLARRIRGFASTLVLPTAQAAGEWVLATFTPNGSWGSLAYTQFGEQSLMQLASITGIYGISFLIAWAASTVNFVWEHRQWPPQVVRALGAFSAALVAVLAFGGARLAIPIDAAPALRIATLSPSVDRGHEVALGNEALEEIFRRTSDEAMAGAQVVLWPEDSFFVYKSDEAAVLERARRLARKYRIHLGLAYGARRDVETPNYENKFVLVTPAGETAWEYLKNHPVPGLESSRVIAGTGGLATHDATDARFAGAICYDGDFPPLFHGAGADVLFLPADDWRGIDPIHSHMSVFRAIEQGASLVRPTMKGLSIATNFRGEVLATSDWFTDPQHAMTAAIPMQRARTIYSMVGDLFAWLCAAGLAALMAIAKPWKRSA